jgi:hypothetical protein
MSRSRVSAAHDVFPAHLRPSASGGGALASSVGARASAEWLADRHLVAPAGQRWHVEIALDVRDEPAPREFDEATATRFHLDIYLEEWGVFFCHGGRSSWIRVTDLAFVHGRDDFQLLGVTPQLRDIGALLRRLERLHAIRFQRQHADIRTNFANVEPAIRGWLATL